MSCIVMESVKARARRVASSYFQLSANSSTLGTPFLATIMILA